MKKYVVIVMGLILVSTMFFLPIVTAGGPSDPPKIQPSSSNGKSQGNTSSGRFSGASRTGTKTSSSRQLQGIVDASHKGNNSGFKPNAQGATPVGTFIDAHISDRAKQYGTPGTYEEGAGRLAGVNNKELSDNERDFLIKHHVEGKNVNGVILAGPGGSKQELLPEPNGKFATKDGQTIKLHVDAKGKTTAQFRLEGESQYHNPIERDADIVLQWALDGYSDAQHVQIIRSAENKPTGTTPADKKQSAAALAQTPISAVIQYDKPAGPPTLQEYRAQQVQEAEKIENARQQIVHQPGVRAFLEQADGTLTQIKILNGNSAGPATAKDEFINNIIRTARTNFANTIADTRVNPTMGTLNIRSKAHTTPRLEIGPQGGKINWNAGD